MSVAVKPTSSIADVAQCVAHLLGLDDAKRLGLALAMVAAQEAERNRAFAERVRTTYAGLAPTKKRSKMLTAFDVNLVPQKRVPGRELNVSAPLDPYFLHEVYGSEQLPTALSIFPVAKLKEGAALVEQRNPGTKPANRGQREALISYIAHHVAG